MSKYKRSILSGLAASLFSFVCHADADLKYESIASITHAINFAASKSVTKDSLDRCIQAFDSASREKWRPGAKKEWRSALTNSNPRTLEFMGHPDRAYRRTIQWEFGGGAHTWCFSELMIYMEYQHYPTYQILETLRSSQFEFEREWNQVDIYTFESSRSESFWDNLAEKIDIHSTPVWSFLSPRHNDGLMRWKNGEKIGNLHLKCYDSQGNEALCQYCKRAHLNAFCQDGDLGDFRSTVRSELDGITYSNGEQLVDYWEVYLKVVNTMFSNWINTFLLWDQGAREKVESEVSREVFTYLDKEMRQLRERFSCSASWDSSDYLKAVEESDFSMLNTDVVDRYKLKPPCEI